MVLPCNLISGFPYATHKHKTENINRARVLKGKYLSPSTCEKLTPLSNADLSQAAWKSQVTVSQLLYKHVFLAGHCLILCF